MVPAILVRTVFLLFPAQPQTLCVCSYSTWRAGPLAVESIPGAVEVLLGRSHTPTEVNITKLVCETDTYLAR